MEDIDGKEDNMHFENNRIELKESGYYYCSRILDFFMSGDEELNKGKIKIYCENISDFPVTVELQDTYTRETAEKKKLSSDKDSFEMEVCREQSLYVDLGNETEGWDGCLEIEIVE